jgi:hypothetical protein
MKSIGKRLWIIPEGYIPATSTGMSREMQSHEAACILNTGDETAHVALTIFYSDREPVGEYKVEVPARRTLHLRFNDLEDPEPLPRGTDYSALFVSNVPVVIQHTRLDSRQPANALMTTLAFGSEN